MSEPFLAEIRIFGFNFAPCGWATCDGQLLAISSNSALFSLLGTTYGGDGRTTFALPDLRSRSPMHQGNGPGLSSRTMGQRTGSELNTLTVNMLPAHNHTVTATAKCVGGAGNSNVADGNVWSKDAGVASATYSSNSPDTDMDAAAIAATSANTGSGNSFPLVHPVLVINYCIALQGVFPSRN